MLTLSHVQARPLLAARESGLERAATSPDLNRTQVEAVLTSDGVRFPSGELVTWEQLEEIAASENVCFELAGDTLSEIRVFSEETNWVRSLYPTGGAPSTLVSGMIMHRIGGTDPMRDTLNKVKAAGPLTGVILDTCTGLGYTAIEAARTAHQVLTVELDPAAIEIARRNPWSADLFDNPRIELRIADVWDVVEEQDSEQFSCIIHDPPTFSFAGELYSADFYAELYRVLKPRGRLFHYIGDPDSKAVQSVMRGVLRRLDQAGFRRVARKPRAFGVVAYK